MEIKKSGIVLAVIVAALGYFVDVFDIVLFSVVRTTSLQDLGVSGDGLLTEGIFLINTQMIGMLIGGILFGVLGDKRGRLSVLFSSILLYSVANVANAFVTSIPWYAVCRFFAGLGLAGELGAGITLVAELLPKNKRGLGTTFVATVGLMGGLAAALVVKHIQWQKAYLIAGVMGVSLLFLRVSVAESGMFKALEQSAVKRGDLKMLFSKWDRVKRLFQCLMPGVPIYFTLGIVVTFAPELGKSLGLPEELTASNAVFYSYIGYISGDIVSGLFSQYLKSRRKALFFFLSSCFLSNLYLLKFSSPNLEVMHLLYVVVGFCSGHWAVFITASAENFGTNLRSTVATSVPNFVRAASVPMTLALNALKEPLGFVNSCVVILSVVSALAFYSVWKSKETFHTDLEFVEH